MIIAEVEVLRADPVSIGISIALSVALSLAAKALATRQKSKSQRIDDSPTTLSVRGSWLPYLVGRHRLGVIFGWAGPRRFGQIGGTIYAVEDGWHQLCVGPAFRLHAIRSQGKVIWKGPISRDTHPSGTKIDIFGEGSFTIYWGEIDQPIEPRLASGMGVASRWPYVCYVYWEGRFLGPAAAIGPGATWALLDYDIEVRPLPSVEIVGSGPWYPQTLELNRDESWSINLVDPANSRIRLSVGGRDARDFIKNFAYVEGSLAIADGKYRVTSVGAPFKFSEATMQYVYLDAEMQSGGSGGFVFSFFEDEDDGANPAHLIWQLMFSPKPHGLGLDTSRYILSSLERIGVDADRERLPSHVLIEEGEEMRSILALIMQDLGCYLTFDYDQRKFRFVMIREPEDQTVSPVPDNAVIPPIPEVETLHAPGPIDRPVFTYRDRTRSFRGDPIPIDDDARASSEGSPRTTEIELTIARDRRTASIIANRRSQEELGRGASYTVHLSRNARDFLPGAVFVLPDRLGMPGSLRVAAVKPVPFSSKTLVRCHGDFYGLTSDDIIDDDEGGGDGVTEPEADLVVRPIELSAFLSPGEETLVVARVRANDATPLADIHLSPDDEVYRQVETEFSVAAGGALLNDFSSSQDYILESGPEFSPIGPQLDIDSVEDLRGDLVSWRSGRQVALIGNELFFVRNITSVSQDVYRLDGLIRARYDTVPQTHRSGDRILIFILSSLSRIDDPLLAPNAAVFLKSQPSTYRPLPLEDVASVQFVVLGRGVVPMLPSGLHSAVHAGRFNAFPSGGDVELAWAYRSHRGLTNRTGAGMQGFGQATGQTDPDGTFSLSMLTGQGGIVRTVTGLSEPRYSYSNADMVSDFGSEPSSFTVSLRQTFAGYTTAPTIAVIEKVDP